MSGKPAYRSSLQIRRGVSEIEAATYLSLSPSYFRTLVDRGVMPRPRLAGKRRIWDIEELDIAFKSLPREGGEEPIFGVSEDRGSWSDFR